MNQDQYKITIAFHGAAAIGTTAFCKQLQALYDGHFAPAGMFQITETKGDDLIVEFTRELEEDREYALDRCPADLDQGLRDQLAVELNDATPPTAFTIIGGPVYGGVIV